MGGIEAPNLGTIWDSGGIMVPEWPPDPKKEPFGVTLGCILGVFGRVFCIRFCTKCNDFVQDCGDFSSYF